MDNSTPQDSGLPPLPEPFIALLSPAVREAWESQMRAYATQARRDAMEEAAKRPHPDTVRLDAVLANKFYVQETGDGKGQFYACQYRDLRGYIFTPYGHAYNTSRDAIDAAIDASSKKGSEA